LEGWRSVTPWPSGGLGYQGWSMWVVRCSIAIGGGPTSWGWGWERLCTTHCTGDSPYQVPPKSGYRSLMPWASTGLGDQGWSIWVVRCSIAIGGGPTSWGWGWERLHPPTVPVTHPTRSLLNPAIEASYRGLAAGSAIRDGPYGCSGAGSSLGVVPRHGVGAGSCCTPAVCHALYL
jgi:hypothetical protein